MKSRHLLLFLLLLLSIPVASQAQDDLMDLLEEETGNETTDYSIATFKGVRIANGHSIETPGEGVLQFLIAHRFGRLNGGFYEFFGLDQANMRISLEYGIKDWLCVGVGRSNINKTYDGFVKAKLLRQSKGKRNMPISVTGVAGIYVNSLKWANPDRENYFSSRLDYAYQLLIARKFSDAFSLQLMPSMVHRNLIATPEDQNDVFSVGVGVSQKITKSIRLTAEYYYVLPGTTADNLKNTLSVGVDIETGGHVFQLVFSNSRAMSENLFIPGTQGDWLDGDIHFGFNIGRVFTLVNKAPKEGEGW